MNDRLTVEEHVGARAPNGCGFLLILPLAVVLAAVGAEDLLGGRAVTGTLFLAGGLALLLCAADFLMRAVKPNRLLLDADGLRLTTWRGTAWFPWSAYRGLGGAENRVLRIERADGSIRVVSAGHWPRGIDRPLHDRATRAGVSLPEPPPRPVPAGPRAAVAGLLLVLASVAAWYATRQ